MEQHGFGRLPSPKDKRDFKLVNFMPPNYKELDVDVDKMWEFPHSPLDQGQTPHCGGFSLADFGINEPVHDDFTNEDGHKFYDLCKIVDGEPGLQNGTTIRSVVTVARNLGRIDAYAFAMTVEEIAWWIRNKGPVIVGTDWTQAMSKPDADGLIHATGLYAGGHAYIINETKGKLFGGQNSWGNWALNGKFYISMEDFAYLLSEEGEAVTAVELPLVPEPEPNPDPIPDPTNPGCVTRVLNFFGLK